jgi:hypothetical protein
MSVRRKPGATEARKHHIIPAFYLAGFTLTGSATGRLHVLHYPTGRRYISTPRKACRETDFYRVEEPGADPNLVENLLAWHEGVVAPFVHHIATTGTVTGRGQVGEALALAASIAARSRRGRHQLKVALASRLAMRLRRGEVLEDDWERLRAAELRNGATPEEVPSYREAIHRLLDGTWFPRAPAILTVGLIPEAQDALLKSLQRRPWELHVTDAASNGGFICSDSPLVWGNLDEAIAGRQQSLESVDIEVTFPVSRNAALVSYRGAREGTLQTTDDVAAHVNMRTLQLSTGLVFHCDDDFLLRRRGGVIGHGVEYFAYVADARARGIVNP